MARQRLSQGCILKGALRGVRLRQQRLACDLSVDPPLHRRTTGGARRQQRLCARRGRRPRRSRRPVRILVCETASAGGEAIRHRYQFRSQRRRRAAVQGRAGGADGGECDLGPRRRRADEGAGQHRTAKQARRQCLGSIDPAHRGAIAFRRHLPGRRSSQRGAAQRSRAGGFGGAAFRVSACGSDPAAGRRRPPRAIADRRHRVGRASALRICRIAAGRDPQADPDHVGTYAVSGDKTKTAGLCRRRCRRIGALSRGYPRQAQIGVRSPGGAPGLRIAVPCLSGNAVAAGAALLFDLIVAVVDAPASSGRGIYKGICSNYLAGRRTGETIQATVRETKAGFRLPNEAAVPIIMVGPGTGLAPFRGFLQERAARKAKGAALGPAMLFFGCRHPDQDFLYADELKAFEASGITELHTAFSRAEGPKTYVQNLVAAQQERVWSLIEDGAIIYVCGDGGKMEPDVKAALVAIYRKRNGADADAGLRWIDDLGTSNRYVLDVWAGG